MILSSWKERSVPARLSPHRRFLAVFFGTLGLGIAGVVMAHIALARMSLLPPPPLTATSCIDDKFAMLRGMRLETTTLLAVGSSATWRNLDMAVLERRFPGTHAFNAAPCYVHIDQTAFLTALLLERMPRVDTVLVVVAPRDFEACPPEQTAFFDPALASPYLSARVPRWLPYITGFRPLYLIREAMETPGKRNAPEHRAIDDRYGSAILVNAHGWRPPLRIDPRCYAGLTRLEAIVAERGARLIIATVPTMPDWAHLNDPDGTAVERWTRGMASALRLPSSLLVDGRGLAWDDSHFADAVHVIYPNHTAYTEFIAEAISRGPRRHMARS